MFKLNKFLNRETYSYLIFGVLTTLVNLGTYKICTFYGLDYKTSTIIAWITAVSFAYITNKFFVFKSKSSSIYSLIKEVFIFVFSRLLSGICDLAFMIVAVDIFHMNDFIAKIITNVFVVVINYLLSKLFVFKQINKETEDLNLGLKKKYKKHSKNIVFLFAFLLPVIIMILIYIARGIFPFGENCFLRTDMYHQYAPFFAELYYKLKNGESLLYSWNIGMGVNFVALSAYYLASPFNFLIYFFPENYIIEFMSILIILRIGLSSLTFSIYSSEHFNTKDIRIIIFSLFYSLSSYMAAYSWNIMWLDCIAWLPLIVLGLERLVKKDKCFMYCIFLGLAIISNYYIAIMICLFLVIYFFGLIFMLEKEVNYFKKFFNFFIFSLLAGGLAAFLILPEFFAIKQTTSGDINFPTNISVYFKLFDVATRHLMNVETSVLSGNYPNVYCGVIIILLFPLYIINKKISTKEKIFKVLLLVLFIISFNMNFLNFIWHGLHYPNSLPCRQSFIYIFLILTMSMESFKKSNYCTNKEVYSVFWGAVIFILITEQFVDFDFSIIYLSLLFLSLYMLIMFLYRNKIGRNFLITILFFSTAIFETFINTEATSVSTTNRQNYVSDNEYIKNLATKLENEDNDFYRIEKSYRRTKNDTAWHNIKGVSLFSSTASEPLTKLFDKFGLMNSTNAYSFEGATPLIASIFNVKYLINRVEEVQKDDSNGTYIYYKPFGFRENETEIINEKPADKTYIYEYITNEYFLPLGFMTNLSSNMYTHSDNPFAVQNSFVRNAVDVDSIFNMISNNTNGNTVTINSDKTQRIYIYINTANVEKIHVTYGNGDKIITHNLDKKRQIVDLGICKQNETIKVRNDEDKQLNISSYSFDEETFKEAYKKLSSSTLSVTSFSETNIKGNINANDSGVLFTSIPYEKGWTVIVNSEEVEAIPLEDAFIGVDIPSAGFYEIEFKYMSEGLKLGIYISLISVTILILIGLILWIKNKIWEV